jgi:hypothetical protein
MSTKDCLGSPEEITSTPGTSVVQFLSRHSVSFADVPGPDLADVADQGGFAVLRKPYAPEAIEAAIQHAAASASGMANVVPFRTVTSPGVG